MLLYNAFSLPHLILHVELWGAAPSWHLNKLIIKQNKLLRSILGIVNENGIPVMRTDDMFKILNVLKLKNLFKLYLFKFMVSMQRGSLPFFYNLLLRPLESNHDYNTRSHVLRHPMLTSEGERRAIAHQIIILSETIPAHLNVINDPPHVLFRKYKLHLLNSQ